MLRTSAPLSSALGVANQHIALSFRKTNTMDLEKLRRAIYRGLLSALSEFQRSVDARGATPYLPNIPVFPNILFVTTTPTCIIYELAGSAKRFNGLKCIHQKCSSNALYFGQFKEHGPIPEGLLYFDIVSRSEISGLGFYAVESDAKVRARFPFFENIAKGGGLMGEGSRGIYIGDHVNQIKISDVVIVNQHAGELRAKYINSAGILSHNTQQQQVEEFINWQYKNGVPPGVLLLPSERAEQFLVAAQFTSLFLSSFVHETKLGTFMGSHPDFVRRALHVDEFIRERTFVWQPPKNAEPAIRPDLLGRRIDGTFDIYDLKTGLLSKRKVTKKRRSRRMLVSELEDGLAQLAHYDEYFSAPENQQYLTEVHGIQLVKPRLTLIGGNQFNTSATEVREALRRFNGINEQYSIVSYDALVLSYMNSFK